MASDMDGGKKQPELFKANLFSPSGGLSLGLGDESFSSPLSLAPALGAAASWTPNSKCALIGTSCIRVTRPCTRVRVRSVMVHSRIHC